MLAERSTNLDELELQLQQKTLHSHLAKINDELLKMSKITVETESAVVEASMACVEAVEVAKQVQEQLEAKRKEEMEELERQRELERIEEANRIAEQERLLEEERKELELMKQREQEANQWPWHTYVYDSVVYAVTFRIAEARPPEMMAIFYAINQQKHTYCCRGASADVAHK